jgi:hypothetical protein
MKKETLEEVAERLYPNYQQEIFIEGAKWQQDTYNQFTLSMDDLKSSREGYLKAKEEYELKQQERMYSEEEVDWLINLLKQTTEYEVLQSFRDKVEKFKKE